MSITPAASRNCQRSGGVRSHMDVVDTAHRTQLPSWMPPLARPVSARERVTQRSRRHCVADVRNRTALLDGHSRALGVPTSPLGKTR